MGIVTGDIVATVFVESVPPMFAKTGVSKLTMIIPKPYALIKYRHFCGCIQNLNVSEEKDCS